MAANTRFYGRYQQQGKLHRTAPNLQIEAFSISYNQGDNCYDLSCSVTGEFYHFDSYEEARQFRDRLVQERRSK